ncbi:MAG: DNA-directed RNA polymerase subunit B'' [Candidatus Methanoperedenaceae archaeon]|nr:DNA-directed RNA polymerase subunit B'' [Candidatus Methanoperedenaceae archaeon]MDW7726411.1 DNA-directed RNA polymerase subunit B'' [Candidatus Methanoperedens sp.]
MIDRSVLSKSYFTSDKIVRHHVDSFNSFLDIGLQKVIDEQRIVETDIEGTHIRLGKIRLGHPVVREADGAVDKLYPTEARLRNITYAAPLHLGMTIVSSEGEKDEKEAEIGLLPIMKGSKVCNLVDLTDKEMIELGEDPQDPGGYFIVNGTERVITTLEDLAPNKIMVEFEERYGDKIEVAKVFSQRRGYRALVVVERSRKSLLEVSFPSISGRINFVTLMRALGIETDEDIVNSVSEDPEIIKFMLENLEEAEVSNKDEAMEKIGIRVASGQGKEYQVKRANYVIDRYLMPHLGNDEAHRMVKAQFLGRMAQACFELALGKRAPADKDHYASKRLKLAGDLMEDLFRVSFNRLTRDIKYQLERASMRNRDLNVSTVVRADVLTERLVHPLATGNWVGGRTGVSQLLDRTDYIASLSHLRRVISPLSRSQPHFEARDLHPTQWGRVCPSETPEGPNCGLVKNFAQLVEISTSAGSKTQIKNMVYEMGVKPIVPQLVGMEEKITTYVTELEALEEAQEMKIEHEEDEDVGVEVDIFE